MSQPPMYPPPGASYTMPPSRPTPVTAAAIVGIVLAGLTLLCDVIGLVMLAAGSAFRAAAQSGKTSSAPPPELPGWMTSFAVISVVLSVIIAIVWLASSIGLLKSSAWAFSLARKLAPIHLALLILIAGVNLILIAPETKAAMQKQLEQQQARQSSTPPPPAGMNSVIASGTAYAGPIFGLLIGAILPVTMLICLSRPSAKDYFASAP